MQTDIFREWLAGQGCTFEQTERGRGGRGHTDMVVRRGGRRAAFPFAGAKEDIDPDEVLRIVRALDLDWSALPGPAGRSSARPDRESGRSSARPDRESGRD